MNKEHISFASVILCAQIFITASKIPPYLIIENSTDIDTYLYLKNCINTFHDFRVDNDFDITYFLWFYVSRNQLYERLNNFSFRYNVEKCKSLSNMTFALNSNEILKLSRNISRQCIINNIYEYFNWNHFFLILLITLISVFSLLSILYWLNEYFNWILFDTVNNII